MATIDEQIVKHEGKRNRCARRLKKLIRGNGRAEAIDLATRRLHQADERLVKKWFKKHEVGFTFNPSKGREMSDLTIVGKACMIIFEVGFHGSKLHTCGHSARLRRIYAKHQARPLVFVQYNPGKYVAGAACAKIKRADRAQVLIDAVRAIRVDLAVPHRINTVLLFHDGFSGIVEYLEGYFCALVD